jgi:hypothetical protein
MSTTPLASAQALSVGIILAGAAATKVWVREHDRRRSLVVTVWSKVGSNLGLEYQPAYRIYAAIVALEGAIAVTIAIPRTTAAGLALATGFFATAVGIALWGRRQAPETICGCFGAADRTSWWTVARAGWLSLASGATLIADPLDAWNSPRDTMLAVLAINVMIVAATSDLIRTTTLRIYGLARPLLMGPNARRTRNHLALSHVVQTPYWRSLIETGAVVSPTPARTWYAGEWTFMDFPVDLNKSAGEAIRLVAAVHDRYTPEWCRMMLVDTRTSRPVVVGSWDSLVPV